MSLLNLTNDGLPNVLVVLYAAVARAKVPPSRDDLLDMVAPAGVVDPTMARQTLNRWTELALFKSDEAGVTLTNPPESDMKEEADVLPAVRKAARRCALSEVNNPELWARQSAKSADLTRSVAWLLAQDIYRLRFRDVEDRELSQVADAEVRLMQNDTRRNGLQFWGHFLGFVRQPGGGDVDPTVAISETLPECIGPGDEMTAVELVERLAEKLPVLDGGNYRSAVEARLERQALPELQPGQLSTSLSRAFFNLMINETLEFQNKSDVGRSIVLSGRDGIRSDHRYSWVRRKPVGRRAR
jgi:hypothetical protein